ncbi:MAG: hypothetical protein QW208_00280 [Acidilobaceae archaeon]
MSLEFEVIEEYIQHGTRRFKVRVKNTKIIFNVAANNIEEALAKARRMAEKLKISEAPLSQS